MPEPHSSQLRIGQGGTYAAAKRLTDFLVAGVAILAMMPGLLIIAIALRLTGEGKVFYRQRRIGKGEQPFGLLKFATMLENSLDLPGGDITLDKDPRVLPLGRFLRKSKINELPQFWNVLIGEMSLVGPRPVTEANYMLYSEAARAMISQISPGLTGAGALAFRDEASLVESAGMDPQQFYEQAIYPDKSRLEIWYFNNRSLITDLKLIILTAVSIPFPRLDPAAWLPDGFPRLESPRIAERASRERASTD